jgi:hypothetical protein
MNIHQITGLSGLTRDQVNTLISRFGVTVWGRNEPGGARAFTTGDAFTFALAGMLERAGFSMSGIRYALAGLPFPRFGADGRPADYLGFAADLNASLLILAMRSDASWESFVVSSLDGAEARIAGRFAIVVDLPTIAARIREAEDAA